jgi:hypothetical protein
MPDDDCLLQKPTNHCAPFIVNDSTALRDILQPGDVLLVEGKGRISSSIKYLTQSTCHAVFGHSWGRERDLRRVRAHGKAALELINVGFLISYGNCLVLLEASITVLVVHPTHVLQPSGSPKTPRSRVSFAWGLL